MFFLVLFILLSTVLHVNCPVFPDVNNDEVVLSNNFPYLLNAIISFLNAKIHVPKFQISKLLNLARVKYLVDKINVIMRKLIVSYVEKYIEHKSSDTNHI